MNGLRAALLDFVAELRTAGVRISIAESLDAMRAVAAAGIERIPMREALAAALIKDEADRPVFDELFARRFAPSPPAGAWRGPARRSGTFGAAGGPNPSGSVSGAKTASPESENEPAPAARQPQAMDPHAKASASRNSIDDASAEHDSEHAAKSADSSSEHDHANAGESDPERSYAAAPDLVAGSEAARAAALRAIEQTPFSRYSDLEYETARDALAILKRRFRARMARRLKLAAAGRIDLRRTLRAAIQHGGSLGELRFRARRPRHLDLLILADISGSMRYASALMLELAAGAAGAFRRVRSFVYIDRLAEAGFEHGRLVMAPPLDLYARSDFGRVLAELTARRAELISRATVIVIMGDGRNNRRPARADLLRELGRHARAILWLNPEAPERWNTGDSAIGQYARTVDAMLLTRNLREVEEGLSRIG
jgi:uncharacterized protein with von Willebrand factor type A (vWA) domain